jgi:hypothetical protein
MAIVMSRIKTSFERAVEAQDDVPAFAGDRLHPVALFARRSFRAEVHIHRRVGIDDEVFLLAADGFVLCLRNLGKRSVMGLGTAQRNISAALVVGAQNCPDPNVMTPLLVGAILLLLLPAARKFGSRAQALTEVAEPATGSELDSTCPAQCFR